MLGAIHVGEPICSGPIFMFPLHSDRTMPTVPLTLDRALQIDALRIEEVSADGSVPELLVQNVGQRPVFLLDGEQVLGLKQNRTFNLSMLLPSESRILVPVSCLERGRWSPRRAPVSGAEHVHFARGRANKMRSVTDSLYQAGSFRSDQRKVWSDIDAKFQAAGNRSATDSEADYYLGRKARLEPLLSALTCRPGQVGVAVGIGGRLLGVDIFGSSDLYEALSEKLLKSYLLDAFEDPSEAAPPDRGEVKAKIERLFCSPEARFSSPGEGETHRWTTLEGTGAALVVADRCIHAVAFYDA